MVIIVFGLPGTGKSLLAEQLAGTFGANYINTDIIREKNELQGQYDEESKHLVYKLMMEEMSVFLEDKKDVIIDGTFHRKDYRHQFRDEAETFGQKIFFIHMKASDESVKKRMSIDREHSEADYEVYLKLKEAFDQDHESQLTFWSDRMKLEEMIEKVLEVGRSDFGVSIERDW